MAEDLNVGDRVRIKPEAEGNEGQEHYGTVVRVYVGGVVVEQPSPLGGLVRWPYAPADLEKIEA